MMSLQNMLAACALLCAVVHLSSGYHRCDHIADSQLTVVDPEWFHDSFEKGFFVVEQGNWNHCLDKKSWFWLRAMGKGRSASVTKEICYNWDGNIPSGKVELPMKCKYTRLEHQECETDFSGTSAQGTVEWSGNIKLLATDNQTYLAGTFCLFGKKSTYWILSTTDKQLDPEIVEKLGKHFQKIGFNNGQTSAKRGVTTLYFDKVTATTC